MTALARTNDKMLASDLLATQTKKFTMEMPMDTHRRLKMIAAAHQTNVKDLIMEAVENYTFPAYQKGVK